ncbi:unnamed protein product [Ostreobium quekettii]|uniref:Uncharacterized protein n=1 Tax=Ostreobium quekettii TaxID=121088 RepID=A0A8S1IV41_9CHLO|nr:unnamed protein product [Ostreobium quekettii]
MRSSKDSNAGVGGVRLYGSEEIRRNGAAPSEAGQGAGEDGWESHVEDWEAGERGARQSKGLFLFVTGTIILLAAAMFAGARVSRALRGQEQLTIFGWTCPTAATMREKLLYISQSRLTKQASKGTNGNSNSLSEAVETATTVGATGMDLADSAVEAETEEAHSGIGGLDTAAAVGNKGPSDDWLLSEEETAGYGAGPADVAEGDASPLDWIQPAADTPAEGQEETVGPSEGAPQTGEDQLLSSEEVTGLTTQYTMDSLRERAQLASRAATAASLAAQQAAAYSATASSASSAAIAAAERAAAAAGSAQIALERGAADVILEAEARAVKAAEAAAKAESRAADAAAMAAGYEDSAEAQAALAAEAADLRPFDGENAMEQWHQWWLSVWARVANFSHRVGVVLMAWLSGLWLAIQQLYMWARAAIRGATSN